MTRLRLRAGRSRPSTSTSPSSTSRYDPRGDLHRRGQDRRPAGLKDTAKGAKRVAEEWAKAQPISKRKVLTDEKKPVTARMIKDAVKEILKPGDVEQLFIYFAGHGVNIHRREHWLLSDAENDPQETVNVTGSEDLAGYCGIPHIVFNSDACRTALLWRL